MVLAWLDGGLVDGISFFRTSENESLGCFFVFLFEKTESQAEISNFRFSRLAGRTHFSPHIHISTALQNRLRSFPEFPIHSLHQKCPAVLNGDEANEVNTKQKKKTISELNPKFILSTSVVAGKDNRLTSSSMMSGSALCSRSAFVASK